MKNKKSARRRHYLVTYVVTVPETYRIEAASPGEAEESAFSDGEFVGRGDTIEANPLESEVEPRRKGDGQVQTAGSAKPITQERIGEISRMLADGVANEVVEREIWQAAKMVPQLVDMIRACIEQLDWFDMSDRTREDADDLRRDARFLIGE